MGHALRQFGGRRPIVNAYSDNCPSLIEACINMGINHDLSEPGVPESNGLMESMVKLILGGARIKLDTGGAPICFYIHAAMHFCMIRNVTSGAWKRRHGHQFPGLLIPFFAKVRYYPAATFQRPSNHYENKTRIGVFVGWVFNTGLSWRKRTYRVIDLADFLGCNLHRRARREHLKVHFQEVHRIVDWDRDAEPSFPL